MATKPLIYRLYDKLPSMGGSLTDHHRGFIEIEDLRVIAAAGNIRRLGVHTPYHGIIPVDRKTFLRPLNDGCTASNVKRWKDERNIHVQAMVSIIREQYTKAPRFSIHFDFLGYTDGTDTYSI